MARYSLFLLSLILAAPLAAAEEFTLHQFDRLQLGDKFYAEGATFGDLNRDGHQDLIPKQQIMKKFKNKENE